MEELKARFEHLLDGDTVSFAFDINRQGVWLVNKTYRPDELTRTWAIVCARDSAQSVLRGLAYLFDRVQKMREFKDTWY